ncbi:hypothetical protein [Thiobacillus sp.]|uniref:hypothetical protein n=1 Tax=Thiobacillus sp. TaxID=924 RepID=UPI0025D6BF1E|nr:hypothetical protein [Thiobacillus sp.]
MKWGTLYPAGYVNKLYGMVRRNIQGPLRFVCLTDDPSGVRSEVECLPCPTVALQPPYNNTGWRKIALWARELPGMDGDWLFLDLDVIVTGSLDDFFSFAPEKSFVVMQNWTQPGRGIGNTSVFRFRVGQHPYIYDRLVPEFKTILAQHKIEQIYISRTISEMAFWPDAWCVLFKTHCVPPMPLRWWKTPTRPATARVIAFPGDPNPHDAVRGIWPVKKPYKKFYKFIRPATWIADYWRE